MTILIRKAIITQPGSPFNGQQKDILITGGIIVRIADDITEKADTIIEREGLQVSPGWVDIFAHLCDPGYEFKETLQTGARAAAAGGYTHVFVLPNTNPVVHSKSQVEYIKEKSRSLPVNIHPLGAISKNAEGKDLAEMYDMFASGAIAFSDGINAVQSAGVLLKALQYVKAFEGVLIQMPQDKSIGAHGLMNEGIISTRLGLPGKPVIAEEMMVARDIELAAYTSSKLHFTGISSQRSVDHIKKAKEKGLQVSCSVTPYHLFFSDEDLVNYDTNLKVNPPLRTPENRQALREAINNGWIDCIATHHFPQEWDSKTCEFEYAGYGMIGLETAFGVAGAAGISAERWVELCSINPRNIFGLPAAAIQEEQPADITLFHPDIPYRFEEKQIQSKSKNSPLIGKELKGKVIGIINGEKVFLNT
ncbi:dihydroorotase [Agriterribacter sp.]|uniref:dihydroorotase n=1 Tax=Agriterribacter sp. TaxID=2821509 RepID=UPI002C7E3D5E|nr:dihydroorotase [Agriterribacter sp.]HTN05774.1 dihydroorotase [Agriterribacter sp.]